MVDLCNEHTSVAFYSTSSPADSLTPYDRSLIPRAASMSSSRYLLELLASARHRNMDRLEYREGVPAQIRTRRDVLTSLRAPRLLESLRLHFTLTTDASLRSALWREVKWAGADSNCGYGHPKAEGYQATPPARNRIVDG
jgi:hypothetical protein